MAASRQYSDGPARSWRGTSRRRFLTLAGAAAGGAVLASLAGAALAADETSATGQLAGTHGGSFADYEIANPSGDKITVTVSYSPFVSVDAHQVGVSVWQGGKRLGRATGTATGLHEQVDSSKPSVSVTPKADGGTVLIRVFNYSSGSVSYTLTVSGATFTAVAAANRAAESRQLGDTASGSLSGDSGGAFVEYRIPRPSGSELTIDMSYAPAVGSASHQVGFEVWQNGKELGKATGKATGIYDHQDSTNPSLTVTPAADAGAVLIKVFNYSSQTVNFTITVAGNTLVQSLAQSLQHATGLVAKQPAGGTLVGSSGGSYADYEIANPGDSKLTLTMSYSPFDAISAHQIGIAVFQRGAKVAHETGTATGLHDKVTSSSPSLTFTPKASNGPVLVRVFNYSDAAISYTLTLE